MKTRMSYKKNREHTPTRFGGRTPLNCHEPMKARLATGCFNKVNVTERRHHSSFLGKNNKRYNTNTNYVIH